MPISEQREDGERVYYVQSRSGETIAGPFNSRQAAQSVDASFNSGPIGAMAVQQNSTGSDSGLATAVIGGREYAVPQYPLGSIPAAQALAAAPINLPDYLVAGLTPEQLAAMSLASSSTGLGQEGLYAGQATTAQALEAAQAAGLDPLGGFGTQAQALLGQGSGLMGQGAELARSVSQGIPDLLNYGMSTAQQAAQQLQESGEFGRNAVTAGLAALGNVGGQFDPASVSAYMNPYEQIVVDQVMEDLARQGALRQQGLSAQAVGSGAFGGSRQAVAEQELARNVLREQARAAGQLRSQGYGQAQQAAMTAFEQARQRDLSAAGLTGQMGMQGASLGIQAGQTAADIGLQASGQALQGAQTQLQGAGQQAQIGQGIGSLGLQTGQLGLGTSGQQLAAGQTAAQIGQQQANLGQQLQGMNLQDIAMLQQAGALGQQQTQSELEAERLTAYQNAMAPYQQIGFLSDVIQGSPMGSTVTQTQPGPSPFSQAAGLMLGGAALYNAFQ